MQVSNANTSNMLASNMMGEQTNFSMISMKETNDSKIPRGKATMLKFPWKIKWGELKTKDLDIKLKQKLLANKTKQEKIVFVYWQIKEFGLELASDSNYLNIIQTILFTDISMIKALDSKTLAMKNKENVVVFQLSEKIKKSSRSFYRVLKRLKKKNGSGNNKYRVKKFEMNIDFGLKNIVVGKIDFSFDFEKIKAEMAASKKKGKTRRKSIEIDI